jgi:hypothetical protein
MKPNKRKYKLESVSIAANWNKSGDECYVVTELWVCRRQWDYSNDYEYKYQVKTFERANEIAKTRIARWSDKQ